MGRLLVVGGWGIEVRIERADPCGRRVGFQLERCVVRFHVPEGSDGELRSAGRRRVVRCAPGWVLMMTMMMMVMIVRMRLVVFLFLGGVHESQADAFFWESVEEHAVVAAIGAEGTLGGGAEGVGGGGHA
jgi:hypothetical protein